MLSVGMHKHFVRYPTGNDHLVIEKKYLSGTLLGARVMVENKIINSSFLLSLHSVGRNRP